MLGGGAASAGTPGSSAGEPACAATRMGAPRITTSRPPAAHENLVLYAPTVLSSRSPDYPRPPPWLFGGKHQLGQQRARGGDVGEADRGAARRRAHVNRHAALGQRREHVLVGPIVPHREQQRIRRYVRERLRHD